MNRRGIAVATLVIMSGTLISSVLGFVRAFVVARLFGAQASTDAFFAALTVPQMFYDQLIGGAVSAVLIPTFSRLAKEEDGQLWLVVRTVFALQLIVVVVVIVVLEFVAHPLMIVIASGFQLKTGGALPLSVKLVRVLLPTLLFSSLSAVTLATLYSLHRRAISAYAPSCYHLGIIVAAVVGAARWGITVLAVGAVAGAAVQFLVQLPALLGARTARHGAGGPLIDFHHPAIRRIFRLYFPVAAGLLVSIAGQVADINFKSHLPQVGGLTSMQYATQIVQFPVGIIAAALAFAVLPSISRDAEETMLDGFKDTLALGMRMSLLLMVPAMVGLLTLATPIVALLYQRGHFTPLDTAHTATALLGYAPQLPMVGIDQLLIYAFYARHNTITPAAVGVLGVATYVVTAALLLVPFTIGGLAIANTVSIAVHTVVLLALLLWTVGSLSGRGLAGTTVKVGIAGAVMAACAWGMDHVLGVANGGFIVRLAHVVIPGAVSLAVYAGLILLLRVSEVQMLARIVVRRVVRG